MSVASSQTLSNIRADENDGLPCAIHSRDNFSYIQPSQDIARFIALELDVSRLNTMATRGLWLAGRIGNISPLHRQRILGRQVIVTEQLDLHLLWRGDYIFVKPLPTWLLDRKFVCQHVSKQVAAAEAMNGFLGTYAKLVSYPSDFHMAKSEGLLPASMRWGEWRQIMDQHLIPLSRATTDRTAPCAVRFQFGELRLSRVNMIYRYHPAYRLQHLVRGYHHGRQTYQSFLKRNFAWLVVVFVYTTIVLTAMQVGATTEQLQSNPVFNRVSAGFAVFSILLPVAALLLIVLSSLALTIYNVRATRKHLARLQQIMNMGTVERLC